MSEEILAIVIGVVIGLVSALAGGAATYYTTLRKKSWRNGAFIYLVTVLGALIAAGFIATIAGVLTGELVNVVLTGIGIVIGFVLGFAGLLMLYERINVDRRPIQQGNP